MSLAENKQPLDKTKTVESPEKPPYNFAETQRKWRGVFSSLLGSYGMAGLPYGMGVGSAFVNNPFIANQRVKRLQTQPRLDVREQIEDALLDPQNNELALRGNTHSVLNQTYPLYRMQYFYEGILSYKHYVQPMYVSREEMDTPRFKSDAIFTDMWIKKLNPQKTFRRIVAQLMAEGKKAYVLRQEYESAINHEKVDYVALQDIPSDWFKVTSITTDSYYGISFDFFYFMTPGADIRQFPPFFSEIFKELMGYSTEVNGTIKVDYERLTNESDRIVAEYNSELNTWAYWAELPADIVWTFCFTEADALAVSPLVSLLLMGSDLANYSLLQQQLVSAPLNSLILGEMVTEADTKHSGWSPDNFFISPEAMGMFEGAINGVLANANIAYKMTPSVKNQMFTIPSVPNAQNVYNEAMRGIINTAGVGALQTLSERPSVAQTNMARITEYRFIDRVYAQFEHFVNRIFEQMWDLKILKYRWQFKIFGNSFLDADEISALEKALTIGQMEFLPRYLALRDMSVLDASTTVDYIDYTGIYDKFKPLVSSFTMQSDKVNKGGKTNLNTTKVLDEGGRPPVDNPENDNTDASKNLGASDARNDT